MKHERCLDVGQGHVQAGDVELRGSLQMGMGRDKCGEDKTLGC